MIDRRPVPDPDVSVYTQPAPHGLWSGNNNFGIEVQFGPDANNRQRVLKLPEWGSPTVWTVSLGIEYSEDAWPSGGTRGFEVVAEISFGVGGATQTLSVDWLQGTRFTLPMNAITVDALYNLPFAPPGEQPRDLRLSVLLGRGGTVTGGAPLKLAPLLNGQFLASLGNNELVAVPARIPKFAKRLFLTPLTHTAFNALTNGNNYVRFFSASDVTGSAFPVGSFRIGEQMLLAGVPVPAFAKYVTLQNLGGGFSTPVACFYNFELSL